MTKAGTFVAPFPHPWWHRHRASARHGPYPSHPAIIPHRGHRPRAGGDGRTAGRLGRGNPSRLPCWARPYGICG